MVWMTQPAMKASKPNWLAIEERKVLREPMNVVATVVGDRVPACSVTVIDFSSLGCRVVTPQTVVAGRFITITFLGFSFKGWIAWSGLEGFGVDFANPVPDPVVSHLFTLALGEENEKNDQEG